MGLSRNSLRQACYSQAITKSTLEALEGISGKGSTHFLDAINGSDSASGKSWTEAYLTMTYAMTQLSSGDTLVCSGKVTEQVTTPVNVFDVTVIGAGNRPRHADASPVGGNIGAFSWTEPVTEVAQAPLVKVIQQGWRFENILFYSGDDNACINLFRDDGSGDDERDASHASIVGCRFASGYDGIHVVEVANILVQDCIFNGMTNFDILGVAGSGIANPLRGHILNNEFFGSANHIKVAGNNWTVRGNLFDDGGTPNTTVVLNMDMSSNGASNFVVDNYFQTTTANFNSPDIVGSATDLWYNNSFDGQANMIGKELGQPA